MPFPFSNLSVCIWLPRRLYRRAASSGRGRMRGRIYGWQSTYPGRWHHGFLFNLGATLALVCLSTASPASDISALTVRALQAASRQCILLPVVKAPDVSLTDWCLAEMSKGRSEHKLSFHVTSSFRRYRRHCKGTEDPDEVGARGRHEIDLVIVVLQINRLETSVVIRDAGRQWSLLCLTCLGLALLRHCYLFCCAYCL